MSSLVRSILQAPKTKAARRPRVLLGVSGLALLFSAQFTAALVQHLG